MTKQFALKLGVFISINLIVLLAALYLSSFYVQRKPYENSQTDSNLLIMPQRSAVDLVILGTSHGRNFARKGNHERVERILGQRVLNLSVGGGGGIIPGKIALDTFYENHNTTPRIVYFIDSFVFYSRMWNEENDRFAQREPFSLSFLNRLLQYQVDPNVIRNYCREKLNYKWLTGKPDTDRIMRKTVTPDEVSRKRQLEDTLYVDKESAFAFQRYAAKLEELVAEAQIHHSNVIFVRPPTLYGKERGENRLLLLLEQLKQKYGVEVYDYSKSMLSYDRFYQAYEDPVHLNTNGVIYFTERYLKPILKNAKP